MRLDLHTPRGRESQAHLRDAALALYIRMGWRYIAGPDAAPLDGVLVSGSGLRGVVEVKCRDLTLDQLFDDFGGDWLITASKVEAIQSAALALGVRGYGLLWLIPSQVALLIPVAAGDGSLICQMRVEETVTQATCNGGTATRRNAYIDVRGAMQIDPRERARSSHKALVSRG